MIRPYQLAYVCVIVFGPVLSLKTDIDFSDIDILIMAFPNIIGMAFLSGEVKKLKDDYLTRFKSGSMKVYK